MILQYCDGVHEVDKINIRHLISHDMLYCKDFFETLSNANTTLYLSCSILVSFFTKSSFQTKGQLRPNLAQNYSTLYLMICHRDFSWNILAWWETGRQRQTKVTLVSFPRNPFLVQLGNLGTIWAKIMQFYGASNCISWYAVWEFWNVVVWWDSIFRPN